MPLGKTYTQLIKFSLIGVVTNLTGYLIYIGITGMGLHPILAMTVLYAIGTYLSFRLNHRLTFRNHPLERLVIWKYFGSYAAGYLVNFLILKISVDTFKIRHEISQAVAIMIIAIMLFALLKFWVFSNQQASES